MDAGGSGGAEADGGVDWTWVGDGPEALSVFRGFDEAPEALPTPDGAPEDETDSAGSALRR